jgi:hypothetical protein
MINTRFEAYKIKRELKRSGIDYEFKRFDVNDFGEPVGEPIVVGTIRGLYHEQNSSVQVTTGDTTQVRTKKIPMILCLYEDTARLALAVGDTVTINAKTFKVTGVVNIQEWNIISDISLEVVDSGIPA